MPRQIILLIKLIDYHNTNNQLKIIKTVLSKTLKPNKINSYNLSHYLHWTEKWFHDWFMWTQMKLKVNFAKLP